MKLKVMVVERTTVNDKIKEKLIAQAVSEHPAPAGIDAAVTELVKRAQGDWEPGNLSVGIHVLVGDEQRPVLFHEVETTRHRAAAFVASWRALLHPPKKAAAKPKVAAAKPKVGAAKPKAAARENGEGQRIH